jgi:acyl-CoA thioester hydrolase
MHTLQAEKFSYRLSVKETDIDEFCHVNNVVYLRWVQEVSTAHWYQVASPDVRLLYTWMIIRHEIDYHCAARLHDELIAYTWLGNYQGARFERFVQICKADTGKVLAEAKTTWCLLDSVKLRPKRIEQDILTVLHNGLN